MGGFGSGRRRGWPRATVDSCFAIDVNRLRKWGGLTPGTSCALSWIGDDDQAPSIELHAGADRVTLSYRVRIGDDASQDVEECVLVVRAACRLGGDRPYFLCPGVVGGIACARRAVKLYALGPYFLCRRCNQVPYTSQSASSGVRANRRAQKIRDRLGGSTNLLLPFPTRPKGMWWRTYARLRDDHRRADIRADEVFSARTQRLLAWARKSNGRGRSAWTAHRLPSLSTRNEAAS